MATFSALFLWSRVTVVARVGDTANTPGMDDALHRADCDVRKVSEDYVEEKILKAILKRHENNRYGHSQGNCSHGEEGAPPSIGYMPDGHGQLEGRDRSVQG
jgi:hypothetical protein